MKAARKFLRYNSQKSVKIHTPIKGVRIWIGKLVNMKMRSYW